MHRLKKTLVGVLIAFAIAVPAKYAYAETCGCSGSGCQGCTIEFQNCDSCSASCENCDIQGFNCENIRWECD